jgi:hypothetical protein
MIVNYSYKSELQDARKLKPKDIIHKETVIRLPMTPAG